MTIDIEWDRCDLPITESDLIVVEKFFGFSLPIDFRNALFHINGGRPFLREFDIENRSGCVFVKLISFKDNNGSRTPITVFKNIENWLPKHLKIVPFADDPFGNFLCFSYQENSCPVVFLDHETSTVTKVCNTFTEFLDCLK